jgi:two-component system response regulator MprA
VVLLDLNEPDHGSAGLASCLRAGISAPIVVLSADAALTARVAALDAGADDFLSKPYALAELLARLRAVLRGRELAAAAARGQTRQGRLSYADVQLDQDTREASRGRRTLVLRYLTFELLRYFLGHPERVLSRQELLEHVWGYPLVDEATSTAGCNVVDVTVSRLRHALEAGGEPRLIHTVRPIGYILRAPRPFV